jgi:glutamate dehydrogenase/leucine dehydrogenase
MTYKAAALGWSKAENPEIIKAFGRYANGHCERYIPGKDMGTIHIN